MKIACRCGRVRGELEPSRAYVRATCYCRDCRAHARWLGGEGLLDAAGGVDVVAMAPAGLRITAGHEQVACMSLGPNGLLRWHAACCRTPLGNTPRNPATCYVGLPVACIDADAASVDASFGPAGRVVLEAAPATAPVTASMLPLLRGIARIVAGLLGNRLRGRRNEVFFDAAGAPISVPHVISKGEREALAG